MATPKLNYYTKKEFDAKVATNELEVSGSSTFSELPTCEKTPTNSNQLATKKYVDSKFGKTLYKHTVSFRMTNPIGLICFQFYDNYSTTYASISSLLSAKKGEIYPCSGGSTASATLDDFTLYYKIHMLSTTFNIYYMKGNSEATLASISRSYVSDYSETVSIIPF